MEMQRRVGWNLLSRVAEQQLRRGSSCILDLVAREEPRLEWEALARRWNARFQVASGRERYEPLGEPELVVDATSSASSNLAIAAKWLTAHRRWTTEFGPVRLAVG